MVVWAGTAAVGEDGADSEGDGEEGDDGRSNRSGSSMTDRVLTMAVYVLADIWF